MELRVLIFEPPPTNPIASQARQRALQYKSRGNMGIQAIPIEIALLIASWLDPEDLFEWALSCRQFGYLIRDNAVCRASLKVSQEF